MTCEAWRKAVRQLARHRGEAMTLIGVLALTAGVTAAAVEVMASYLWRPLPYPAADRLVVVDYPRPNGPSPRDLQLVDATGVRAFADLVVASDPDSFTVLGAETPFTTDGRWTSGDVFPMFAVQLVLGRAFTAAEAAAGEPLALIGHHVWQEHFGGRADILGRTITVRATIRQGEAETFTIAGVLPPRFWHLEERTSLLLPLKNPRLPWLMRLRDGVSADEAAARVTAIVRQQLPGVGTEWHAVVRDARDAHVERVRPMLAATGWGVLLLAAVAVANLGFLQMARGVARQREIAVRSVLGASRLAIIRELLAEGMVSGAAAAIAAALVAQLLLRTGAAAVERYFGRVVPAGADRLGADPVVMLATVILTLAAALILALVMFAASKSASLPGALAGGAAATDTPARLIVRQLIVSWQVAVAFCLLVSAALMIRTAWHLGHVDLGFEPRNVLSANLTLHEATYRSLDERREFFRTLLERLDGLPEITRAGITGWLPFRIGPAVTVEAEGAPAPATAAMQGVDAGYFEAMRLRLREGRFLRLDDRDGRERVAVIDRSLARVLWADQSPLGRKFRIRFSPEPGRGFGPYTIVGVVDAVRQSVMNPTPPQLYVAFLQQPLATNGFLQLKPLGPPLEAATAVARILRGMNPELALGSVNSLEAIVEAEGMRPRLLARALAAFAALAIVIAAIGLYAVSAWIAQLRQREAALRVALGGRRVSVAALLARRGMIAIAAGLVIGWIAAAPLTGAIASELRGIAASDVTTRLLVAILLLGISVAALFGPAWKASTTELAALLKTE